MAAASSVKGTNIVFETAMGPGWSDTHGNLTDARKDHQGPLPKDWAHYEGSTCTAIRWC